MRSRCLYAHPPIPGYSLLGFRVLPPNPPSKGGYGMACGALATTSLFVYMLWPHAESVVGGTLRNQKYIVVGAVF